MSSTPENLPRVSVILPTLNAGAILENCIASIARQTYPREKIEILLADAHSTDDTRAIANKFGAIILDDDGKNMEEGKRLALRHATGEYIVFVDADNEITHPDYLALAVAGLRANPQALGVESYYLPSPKMSSFCAYLTHRLHISDPIAWLMSANPQLVARAGDVERWRLPDGTFSYPLGANGFVYRRADLESVQANEKFQDTHVAMFLMKNGKREWLRIHGRGVHHYYIQTLWKFVQKRRRATVHFLRVQQEMPVNWMREKPPVPLWLAAVYCVTFFGPAYHTLRGLFRDRDGCWGWHLLACPASVLGNAWGVWTYQRRGQDKSLIADLRVEQTLKTEQKTMASPAAQPATAKRPRVVCFVNGIFAGGIGGGDIYFYHIARAILMAGHSIHFFGGHALKNYLERNQLPLNLSLTDSGAGQLGNVASLPGQFRLLWDFGRRLRGALARLNDVQADDVAYAMSDYWFDTIPLIRCRARAKILYLGMMAPSFRQVVFKSRADVTSTRLASLYYWLSQQLSLRWFRRVPDGIVTYSHPEMRDYLLRFGYAADRLAYVPNGSDVAAADRVPAQAKQFDLAWTGRVHPQKGIDDLLATMVRLKQQLPDFRAVIIGKSKDALEPVIRQMGLAENVFFSGLVSEEEKFRLLKASRVFGMPSRYESWGIVVGEALVAGTPVVGYRLDCYPPVFGDFVRYVQPFDAEAFINTVVDEVKQQRVGNNYLAPLDLARFKRENSWSAAQERFQAVLADAQAPA
jgi:glycosyltransferase involved in cell wall biosynthesis